MKNKESGILPGLVGTADMVVTELHTAERLGSGSMPVLATPAMIALMEIAAQRAIEQVLPVGHMTVGTHLDVSHHGATPVGARVSASAELLEVRGRILVFNILARDDLEVIGECVHQRTLSSIAGFKRLLLQKTKRTA